MDQYAAEGPDEDNDGETLHMHIIRSPRGTVGFVSSSADFGDPDEASSEARAMAQALRAIVGDGP